MSEAGKQLSNAMEQPGDWRVDRYTMRHIPSGCVFWIANGGFFFDGYEGTPKCLGLLERHWLYWKSVRMRNAQTAARFAQAKEGGQ